MTSELRLFISSTFIDFRDERDYLAKKVFPALRRLCRERGVEFTEIDFRWGLTDEDSEKGRILRTCFQEIDNCRPFFVGLLGERDGWIPSMDEIAKDPELQKEHPWLEAATQEGHSVTELEFRHGFLNHGPAQTKVDDRSSTPLIYFRSRGVDDPDRRRSASTDAQKEEPRVSLLKKEVSEYLGSIPAFRTPEELASLIERDLTSLIERHWPLSKKESWLDEERAGHAAFAQSRRKAYVPNPQLVSRLDEHLDTSVDADRRRSGSSTADDPSSESVLVLKGESGAGKSSLLAYWAEKLRTEEADRNPALFKGGPGSKGSHFIIEHYVGVTQSSTDPDTLIRRIIEEIRERTHSDDPIPQSSEELEQSFPAWLGRIAGERLLIVVDAINQFAVSNVDDRSSMDSQFLRWLPDHMPGNIKWVISSTEGEALERLRARGRTIGPHGRTIGPRGWPELEVAPISLQVRRSVVRAFLASYRKRLVSDQEEKIVTDPKASSPLFLRTLLEELRLQGTHSKLDRQIDHYLASEDIPDLFARILERLESDYGTEDVQALLTRIWAAPFGLTESELLESSGLERTSLSLLLHAFDYHFVRWKGRLSFFHDHLRAAVERRYLNEGTEKKRAWVQLASYFEGADASPITALSLPWLWNRAEQWERLKDSLLDLRLIPYLTEDSHAYDLLGYWRALEKRHVSSGGPVVSEDLYWNIDVVAEYETALDQHRSMLGRTEERELLQSLASFFYHSGWTEGAISYARRALDLFETDSHAGEGENDHRSFTADAIEQRADLCSMLGTACLEGGNIRHASEALEHAMQLLAERSERFDLREMRVRNIYARMLQDSGKYTEAETLLQITLSAAEAKFGQWHASTIEALGRLADILALQGKYAEAETIYRTVLQRVEAAQGPKSMEMAGALNDLANFLRRFKGDYQEAQHLFERSVAILEDRLGDKHPDVGTLLNNLASLFSERKDWVQAEPLFLQSLAIHEAAHGPEHPKTATSLNNYAAMLYQQGAYDRAEELYRRALAIRRKVLGDNHPVTAISYLNLANNLKMMKSYAEAKACFERALEIQLATVGPSHPNTGHTLELYGRLKREMGELSMAADFLSRAYTIRKNSFGPDHSETIAVAIDLAEILFKESQTEVDDPRRLEGEPRSSTVDDPRRLEGEPRSSTSAQRILNEVLNAVDRRTPFESSGVRRRELPDDIRQRLERLEALSGGGVPKLRKR